ncbi:MAG: hypothetical protein ACK559_30795, partial [bacterium]
VAVVQHVGPLVLGHLASGPVLKALEEFVNADAVSRSEGHEVHLPRFMFDVEMQLFAFAPLFHHGYPPDRKFTCVLRVEKLRCVGDGCHGWECLQGISCPVYGLADIRNIDLQQVLQDVGLDISAWRDVNESGRPQPP